MDHAATQICAINITEVLNLVYHFSTFQVVRTGGFGVVFGVTASFFVLFPSRGLNQSGYTLGRILAKY